MSKNQSRRWKTQETSACHGPKSTVMTHIFCSSPFLVVTAIKRGSKQFTESVTQQCENNAQSKICCARHAPRPGRGCRCGDHVLYTGSKGGSVLKHLLNPAISWGKNLLSRFGRAPGLPNPASSRHYLGERIRVVSPDPKILAGCILGVLPNPR